MSKVRDKQFPVSENLDFPEEGDLRPYVIFTQLKPDGPHLYAGWLDAADATMAVQFGCEHYGRDQECVSLWAIPRTAISGTDLDYPPSEEPGTERPFRVFTQAKRGDGHVTAGTVDASSGAGALDKARAATSATPYSIWVVSDDAIAKTKPDELIWPLSDQTYRLARGYSKTVREKWEKIRAEKDLETYERDDLKETF